MIDQKALLDLANVFLQSPKGKDLVAKAEAAKAQASGALPPGVTVEDVRNRVKNFSAKEYLNTLKQYVPVIQTFSTTGRVYDKQTNLPIQGVKVTPEISLFPMVPETVDVKENIVDENGQKQTIIVKKQVFKYDSKAQDKFLKSDAKGEFTFRFGVPVIPALGNKVLVKPFLLFEMDDYAPDIQQILNGNNEVLQTLPIKGLLNINVASKIEAEKIKKEMNGAAEKAANIALTAVEKTIVALKNRVLKFASIVQNKLLPLAIGLFILFGITKLAQADAKQYKCPNNALLRACIARRNSIVRQLNQIYGVIILSTVLGAIFLYFSAQFKSGKLSIGSLPFPVATPPGTGVPYSLLAKLQDIEDLFKDLENINKELRKAIIISLIFLIICLIIILRYLKKIDLLIENCSDGQIPMEEINAELLALTVTSEEEAPILQFVNGFKMDVVVDQKSKVGDLYRRYATASDSSGVVVLKGEPSFSAQPQILIDELAFYIRNNNLKAN
jgi:hypothetical protein